MDEKGHDQVTRFIVLAGGRMPTVGSLKKTCVGGAYPGLVW